MIKPRELPVIHQDILGNWVMADWWHFLFSLCELQGCVLPGAILRR